MSGSAVSAVEDVFQTSAVIAREALEGARTLSKTFLRFRRSSKEISVGSDETVSCDLPVYLIAR